MLLTDAKIAHIPDELKTLPRWVLWKYQQRKEGGKPTKIPYSVATGERAKSNDPATWGTFAAVWEFYQAAGTFDGIGFMFAPPYVGIDMDNIDSQPEDGKAKLWQIVADANTYTETSPSGNGLHLIGKAKLEKGFRYEPIEVYPHGRFFTVTGDSVGKPRPIRDIQKVVDTLYSNRPQKAPSERVRASQPPTLPANEIVPTDAAAVIAKIRKSKQSALFTELFDNGDLTRYNGDDSAADMALMNMLPFWTGGSASLMEEVFSLSALARREKWQKRQDYRQRTIAAALASWNGETYGERLQLLHRQENKELTKEDRKTLAMLGNTDEDNARRLVIVYGDFVKFVQERASLPDAWRIWNGKNWEPSYDYSLYGYLSSVKKISLAAIESFMPTSTDAQRKAKDRKKQAVTNLSNMNRITACLERLRGSDMAGVSQNLFDRDEYLLNCQNGMIDLKTGDLLPHDRTRYCSKICRAEYQPQAWDGSTLWEKTVAQIIPDEAERRYIQKWCGYLLVGNACEEQLLFAYGEGGSGKGTLFNTIAYAMGTYADAISIEVFLQARNDGGEGKPSPEIAKLVGTRAAFASESGLGRRLNDAKIKNITGRDTISARFLYGQSFSFLPCAKFVIQSNDLPTVGDATDSGIRRRLVIAPFMEGLSKIRNPHLKEQLREPEHLAVVLSWCVAGCLMWQKEELGEPPTRYKQTARKYYDDSDILQDFLDECCVIGSTETTRIRVQDFVKRFNEWNTDKPIKRAAIVKQMAKKGFPQAKMTIGQVFRGLEMKAIPS